MSRESEVGHNWNKVFISWRQRKRERGKEREGGREGGRESETSQMSTFLFDFKYLWHCSAPPEVQRLSTEYPHVQVVQYQSARTQ